MFNLLVALLGIAAGVAAGCYFGLRPDSGRTFRDLHRHRAGREQQEREYQERRAQ